MIDIDDVLNNLRAENEQICDKIQSLCGQQYILEKLIECYEELKKKNLE